MVRSARFAFDHPRGPARRPLADPFDAADDPLFELPLSGTGDVSGDDATGHTGRTDDSVSPADGRNTRRDRAA